MSRAASSNAIMDSAHNCQRCFRPPRHHAATHVWGTTWAAGGGWAPRLLSARPRLPLPSHARPAAPPPLQPAARGGAVLQRLEVKLATRRWPAKAAGALPACPTTPFAHPSPVAAREAPSEDRVAHSSARCGAASGNSVATSPAPPLTANKGMRGRCLLVHRSQSACLPACPPACLPSPTCGDIDKVHSAVGSRRHQTLAAAAVATAAAAAAIQHGARQQRRLQLQVLQAGALPHVLQPSPKTGCSTDLVLLFQKNNRASSPASHPLKTHHHDDRTVLGDSAEEAIPPKHAVSTHGLIPRQRAQRRQRSVAPLPRPQPQPAVAAGGAQQRAVWLGGQAKEVARAPPLRHCSRAGAS